MRAPWAALRESLFRSVLTLKADRQFEAAGEKHKVLERFAAPDAMVAYLTTNGGDLDEKDRIYSVLVRAVQAHANWRELATALILLGLWPGLTVVYGRRLKDYWGFEDELAAEISFIFTTMVAKIDLRGVNRLAATLVRNVDRDVRKVLKGRWAEQKTNVEIDDPAVVHAAPELHTQPTIADRDLPVDAGDLVAVRQWLVSVVHEDADLVIGAAIYGYDQRELGDALSIGHAAARKRYRRAVQRVRDHLGGKRFSVSHLGRRRRV